MGEFPIQPLQTYSILRIYIFHACASQSIPLCCLPQSKNILDCGWYLADDDSCHLADNGLLESQSFAGEFLAYFYPIGDLVGGVAALALVITFRLVH